MRKLKENSLLWIHLNELTNSCCDCPGGSVRGAGQQSEAMERKPHHFQIGSPLHSRMGSLQCHSNGKILSVFVLIHCAYWFQYMENLLSFS